MNKKMDNCCQHLWYAFYVIS